MPYRKNGAALGICLALSLACCSSTSANPCPTLYVSLGGQAGVTSLVERFATHLYTDPVIGPFFVGVDPVETRRRLFAQFCDLAGGPCKTVNPDMKKTHAGMDITAVNFQAVIGLLRQALDEGEVSASVQEQFIMKVMPLQAAIVNAP